MSDKPKLKALNALEHGNLKLSMQQPGRWPTIPIGSIVEYVDMFEVGEDVFCKIIGPNGQYYDVPPYFLEEYYNE